MVAFAINRQGGSLTYVNTQPPMGVNPCYITIDRAGSRVLVANHGQSNLAAARIVEKNGIPEIENV